MSWQRGRRKSKYSKHLPKTRVITITLNIDLRRLQDVIKRTCLPFDSCGGMANIFQGAATAVSGFAIALSRIQSNLVITKEGVGVLTCRFNAHSNHLRCAVNPCGPCDGCQFYEK